MTTSRRLLARATSRRWAVVAAVAAATMAIGLLPAMATSAPVRAATLVDSHTEGMVHKRGDFGWRVVTASDALGGSYVRTSDKPSTAKRASVSIRGRGSVVRLFGCRSPRSGYADVYVDDRRVATLDLYQPYTSCGRLLTRSGFTDGEHTVAVFTTGKKRKASAGTYVSVDAMSVS